MQTFCIFKSTFKNKYINKLDGRKIYLFTRMSTNKYRREDEVSISPVDNNYIINWVKHELWIDSKTYGWKYDEN